MTMDHRKKNISWWIDVRVDGCVSKEDSRLAVLMDIRDELQSLVRILSCQNFLNIPQKLDAIRKNTTPKRKPRRKTKP